MARSHTVQQGECLVSIASAYGLSCKAIWNAPENESLRSKRSVPNILFPGDVLHIPDLQLKHESRPVEKRHRFRKLGTPVWLRVRLLDVDQPRADEPYFLRVDTLTFEGNTDRDGKIEHQIPAAATEAFLRIGGIDSAEDYILKIGALDPIDEVSGVQARLSNLGFSCGEIDGIAGPATQKALRSFQQKYNLEPTGKADEVTRHELKKQYGS